MTGIAGAGIAIRGIGLIQRLGALAQSVFNAHPLAVLAALSLALNGWQWHEAGVAAHDAAARAGVWQKSFDTERTAFASLLASHDTLLTAINTQNPPSRPSPATAPRGAKRPNPRWPPPITMPPRCPRCQRGCCRMPPATPPLPPAPRPPPCSRREANCEGGAVGDGGAAAGRMGARAAPRRCLAPAADHHCRAGGEQDLPAPRRHPRPTRIGPALSGDAAHDAEVLAAALLAKTAWGDQAEALLTACAGLAKNP